MTRLTSLRLADPAELWTRLGFTVTDSSVLLGGVDLELGNDGEGIVGWRLDETDGIDEIDGLPTGTAPALPTGTAPALPTGAAPALPTGTAPALPTPAEHPNGAIGLDHVVVTTPDFDRTAAALAAAGIPLRRIREAPGGIRQGFRRLGPAILELVEVQPDGPRAGQSSEAGSRAAGEREAAPGPAQFWGLVVIVRDLDALAQRLGDQLGAVKDAVQPGRRIATLRASAGLGEAVAFMSPEP